METPYFLNNFLVLIKIVLVYNYKKLWNLCMDKKIIEIASDGIRLSIKRGFLCIENDNKQSSNSVPLSDIVGLVLSSNKIMISKNTINAVTDNGGTIICCGNNYMPTSITTPYAAHWQTGERIRKQISAPLPLQKSLWKDVVKKKIRNQALILKYYNSNSDKIERLNQLADTVKSGDTGNNEAIAAQIYFKAMFGKNFIRNRQKNDMNIWLNYTYMVLRACVARAIAGAGLLPSLGIMHSNKLNPFTLVDDIMEPYRPLADSIVFGLMNDMSLQDNYDLTPKIKRSLTNIIATNLETDKGQKPLAISLCETANSLANSYIERKNLLKIDNYINRDELLR